MSSRVFEGDIAGVSAVPWRLQTRRAFEQPRLASDNPERSEELQELTAKVAHLNAAVEQKSREAWDNGLRAGEAAARQALENDTRATVERLCATIVDVAAARADVLRRAEADTVRLSVEIARRVLHRELSIDSSALEALIKAALIKLEQQEVYRVRVHPELGTIVRACLDQTGRGAGVEVISDPTQARGGACFEISRGVLDASVDTQLREIERGLTDELQTRT
jgi:flagellar assembly protein FliH